MEGLVGVASFLFAEAKGRVMLFLQWTSHEVESDTMNQLYYIIYVQPIQSAQSIRMLSQKGGGSLTFQPRRPSSHLLHRAVHGESWRIANDCVDSPCFCRSRTRPPPSRGGRGCTRTRRTPASQSALQISHCTPRFSKKNCHTPVQLMGNESVHEKMCQKIGR